MDKNNIVSASLNRNTQVLTISIGYDGSFKPVVYEYVDRFIVSFGNAISPNNGGRGTNIQVKLSSIDKPIYIGAINETGNLVLLPVPYIRAELGMMLMLRCPPSS